jgi:putative membrane protein
MPFAKEKPMPRLVIIALSLFAASTGFALAQTKPSAEAEKFANAVASATAFEIQSSQLAQQNAKSADLKAFADQMISDHTKAAEEFKAALAQSNIPAPKDSMGVKDLANYERLHLTTANSFDGAYARAQLSSHKDAVALFKSYAANGKTPQLKTFAAKTLPTLQHHLQMIQSINQKLSS